MGVAINLALPLYYLREGLEPAMIGIITSGSSMAYLISPFAFRNVHKKIGMKKSFLISVCGFLLIMVVFQISLNPWLVYFLMIAEGILLGLYWPILMTTISVVSNSPHLRENDTLKDKLMNHYSLAWNIGGIVSFIIGTILLYIVDDINIMFGLALIYAILLFVCALLFEEPKSEVNNNKEPLIVNEKSQLDLKRENIRFPIYLPIIFTSFFSFFLGAVSFAYPVKSEALGFALFTNYLFSFFRMGMQTLSISQNMKLDIKLFKRLIPISLIILLAFFIFMGFNVNIIFFGVLLSVFGFFVAFLYSFSFKLFIFRNMSENTSKYSIYFETMIGVGFFLAPIITGFIASFSVNFSFFFMALVATALLVFFLALKHKISTD